MSGLRFALRTTLASKMAKMGKIIFFEFDVEMCFLQCENYKNKERNEFQRFSPCYFGVLKFLIPKHPSLKSPVKSL